MKPRKFICTCIRPLVQKVGSDLITVCKEGNTYECYFYCSEWVVIGYEWRAHMNDEMFNEYFRVEE